MNLDTLDKSFLRLVTDFSEAKGELMTDSQYIYKNAIVISPNEKYLQISNSLTDIAFDDSYIVTLVDCSDNVVSDITEKVFINEFQDINGIYQIAFEISPILQDFYFKRLFLKFKHIGSDLTLWSNAFLCTDNVNSIRLDYKNYSYFQGISYDRANFYQSIRLASYYDLPSPKDTTIVTALSNGDIRRARPTQAIEYNYNVDALDTFTFDRIQTTLNSDLVYINGVRFITSENIQADERQGKSNEFSGTFKGQFLAKERYTAQYQIKPNFTYVSLSPLGNFRPTTLPTLASVLFNENIASIESFSLFDYDTDAQIVSNFTFTGSLMNLTIPSLPNGKYYFNFRVVSLLGEISEITDKETYSFSIRVGDFSNLHFNSNDFFIN